MKRLIYKILSSLIRKVGKVSARHHGRSYANLIRALFKEGWMAASNHDYNFDSNGEAFILERIGKINPQVIVDVGANTGDWAIMCAQKFNSAKIYSFEPIPDTYQELEDNCKPFPQIKTYPYGLSSKDEIINFQVSSLSNELSSAVKVVVDDNTQTISCQTKRADHFFANLAVSEIDFLKIDVEGFEYDVLLGFENFLKNKKIKVIQFEYGKACIYNQKILFHLYQLLESHGFTLGKLWPNGVEFKDYRAEDEDFIGPNYIACQPEWIKALS